MSRPVAECVSGSDTMTCYRHALTLGVSGGQADLRVDVQQIALAAAGRHNSRGAVGLIVFEVIASHWTSECILRAGL